MLGTKPQVGRLVSLPSHNTLSTGESKFHVALCLESGGKLLHSNLLPTIHSLIPDTIDPYY